MLQEFLAGSYKRYKQDIALFITWLAKAASSVGYIPNGTKHGQSQQTEPLAAEPTQSAVPKGARLKGKARKAAKDAAGKAEEPSVDTSESLAAAGVKYTITTGELIHQAEAVAHSYLKFDVKMPASLQVVVERVVRARKRCSEWYQKSGVGNQYADKQHTYFIGILEQSLKILEPCVESRIAGSEQQTKMSPCLRVTASLIGSHH
ncbi:MAG: hypothetical protein L6R42_008645 [Xanthoria sp. 1 TBL-2021]|nr:MAG: hypothetical protein L6R42_008645 [Xanthoria sp. 1 TBL-2021]